MADENKVLVETPEMNELLVKSGSTDLNVSRAAMHEIAKALELPLREGIVSGDIIGNIFERVQFPLGAVIEYPLHWLAPGTEKDYVAYTVPSHGRIPDKEIDGDYVTIPTYDVGASITWRRRYQRDARWDIQADALSHLRAQFTKKLNDDGMHVLINAGFDRNIMVYDSDASSSQFTKRLVSLMKVVMRRNGGGNSTSVNRFKLTDLLVSPEAIEDMRNWNVDQVDEFTRREIFTAEDGSINRIFSVNIIDLDELGENQEYQLFYNQTLGGNLPSGKTEIVIGLDLSRQRSFVMPVREDLQLYEYDTLMEQRRVGYWGTMELGFAALDGRAIVLGSY